MWGTEYALPLLILYTMYVSLFSVTHLLIHPDALMESLRYSRIVLGAKDARTNKYCLPLRHSNELTA